MSDQKKDGEMKNEESNSSLNTVKSASVIEDENTHTKSGPFSSMSEPKQYQKNKVDNINPLFKQDQKKPNLFE